MIMESSMPSIYEEQQYLLAQDPNDWPQELKDFIDDKIAEYGGIISQGVYEYLVAQWCQQQSQM